MGSSYVQQRLKEYGALPKREPHKTRRKKQHIPVATPVIEEWDMIEYGDDRFDSAVMEFLSWLESVDNGESECSYLYIAHDENNNSWAKVGYTTKPKHRLSNLNTSYPGRLEWMLLFPFPETKAHKAEHEIHTLLKKYAIPGKKEWFYKEGLREHIDAIMEIICKNNQHARVREYYDTFGTPVDFDYDHENQKERWYWTVDVGQWEDED